MVQFKRKLYRRGSSYETTIPLPLLFTLDSSKKYNVIFDFDSKEQRWFVNFVEREDKKKLVVSQNAKQTKTNAKNNSKK